MDVKMEMNKNTKACRICLTMDIKLYNMNKYNLTICYRELTDFVHSDNDKLPQELCWECAHRLLNYKKFKNKALRSQELLASLLDMHNELPEGIFKTIDRKSENLITNLCIKNYKVDHTDVEIQYDEHEDKKFLEVKIEEESIIVKTNDSDNDQDEKLENDVRFETEDDVNDNDETNITETTDILTDANKETCKKDVIKVIRKGVKRKYSKCDTKLKKTKRCYKNDRTGDDKKNNDDYIDTQLIEIKFLTEDEQLEEILKRKESSNYKNSPYKCEICYKGFLHQEIYERHSIHHTEVCGTHQCKICKIRTKKRYQLTHHAAKHEQKYSCKVCPFVARTRSAANRHCKYHNGKRYTCNQCSEIFEKYTSFMSHVRTKHPSDIVCALCGHSFVSRKGLHQHNNLKHRFQDTTIPSDGPTCVQCDIVFKSQRALDTHLALSTKHNVPLDSSCRRRIRKIPAAYKRPPHHKPPEGPIPCEQCGLELPNATMYDRHFRKVHPGINRTKFFTDDSGIMCEVCGQMVRCMALLKDHYDLHNSSGFECEVCGKRFGQRSRLSLHQRVHSTAHPLHPCTICGRQFTLQGNMVRHRNTVHMNQKKFECDLCGKNFKQLACLKIHIDCVHHKKPWPKRNRKKKSNISVATTSSLESEWEGKQSDSLLGA